MAEQLLGLLTAGLNVILLIVLVIALFRYYRTNLMDMQFMVLIVSILLLLPVITFENILFIDLQMNQIDLRYNVWGMRFFFIIGILGYFVYNLHLLTIEDMPSFPTTITGIICGFAIGSMMVSAKVDPNATQPIYYEPLTGGMFFILSMLIFNLVGAIGFFSSLYLREITYQKPMIRTIDMIAIFSFFFSPIVIYIARIYHLLLLPVNSIFLLTELAFILHLIGYIHSPLEFGYPTRSDLTSISIIEMESNVVIAGYSLEEDRDFNKLQGMTIMAVDSVIKDVFETESREDREFYSLDYGDTILLRNRNYLLVGMFLGKGKKIGRVVLRRLLKKMVDNLNSNTSFDVKSCFQHYIFTFLKKKHIIAEDQVYLSDPNQIVAR